MIAPATLVLTLMLCVAILNVPRKHVISIYVIGMCFVPADQAMVISGLDFKVLRIFAFVGCLRIVMKGEHYRGRLNLMDWLYVFWVVAGTLAYLLVWGSGKAFIYKLGVLVDTFMLYYVFRSYITDIADIVRAMMVLVGSIIVMTPFVMFEQFYGVNPFYILGRDYTSHRDGRIRCSAAFSHAILLGSFAASIMPMSIALLRASSRKNMATKLFCLLGVVCSIYVTIASASSGPILALMAGIGAVLCFRYRKYAGIAAYGLFGLVIFLHLTMKAPVWHLFSRIDVAGGSTGYHRYHLYDQTVNNFSEWALIGVKGVAHWNVWAGDITSMYVAQAVFGGLLTLLLFIWMVALCLRFSWRCSLLRLDLALQWLLWGFFCSFLTHVVSFLSVSYFGQITMLMTMSFAMCAFLIQRKKRLMEMGRSPEFAAAKQRRKTPLFNPA